MTTTTEHTEFDETMTDEQVDVAVARLLGDADVTLDELRTAAEVGAFDTERQRRAWFVIRGLGRG